MAITSESVREIFKGLENGDGAAFFERVRPQRYRWMRASPAVTVLGLFKTGRSTQQKRNWSRYG